MADDTIAPGGCYPSDFIGPLPEGGQYCNAPNTPSVFGALNSILAQGARTAATIRQTINQYAGKTTPVTVTVQPTSAHSGVALLLLAAAVGVVVWLVIRERG